MVELIIVLRHKHRARVQILFLLRFFEKNMGGSSDLCAGSSHNHILLCSFF